MNKRCIVNFADGEFYTKMQLRLMETFTPCTDTTFINGSKLWSRDPLHNFESTGRLVEFKGIDLLLWKHALPPGARPHAESPYGFKVHCIKAAYDMGYTSILWVDSPAYAVKEDISPIFEKIEKEGYYAMSHIDPLINWVSSSLNPYNEDDLKDYNLPSGSCLGFSLKGWGDGDQIFYDWSEDEKNGKFRSEVFAEGKCHRHDEAMLGLVLRSLSLPVFTHDPLFQSDSPECVIKSGGDIK